MSIQDEAVAHLRAIIAAANNDPDCVELTRTLSDAQRWLKRTFVESVTSKEMKALEILAKQDRPVGPYFIGENIWGTARGSSSAPFARPAGKLLKRLQEKGYAMWVCEDDFWGWCITANGVRLVERSTR